MRIYLHIGPDAWVADRLQSVLDSKRDQLADKGILFARSPARRNHTRLFMAVSDPATIDALRYNRGFADPGHQGRLLQDLQRNLTAEVERIAPQTLILSAHQLGSTLASRSELERLRALLAPLSQDIQIIAHVEDPARMLVHRYISQIFEGRDRDLGQELGLIGAADWWAAARATRPAPNPGANCFPEVQGAPHWLDLTRLVAEWDGVFGAGATRLRGIDRQVLAGPDATHELRAAFDIPLQIGRACPVTHSALPSAAWITRARRFNDALRRMLGTDEITVPRPLWRRFLTELKRPGEAISPGSLRAISDRFARDRQTLMAAHPGLTAAAMAPDAPLRSWTEADPEQGFRPTQYLMAFAPRIKKATRTARIQQKDASKIKLVPPNPSLPQGAKDAYARIQTSVFAPHNRMGHVNEADLAAAYAPAPPRRVPPPATGRVIVACMKNEAPYILEWVAYHRAIGVDTFVVYTNDCDDGTSELLDRLDQMGILHHRNNTDWTGKSPQQHALDQAMKDPVVQSADWISHIDVDEFINVRCGNGTLDAFLAQVPDATNIAMTWRLFGHNGVTGFKDRLVIDQFDAAAPKFCPKPHTVWGFKSMFRNTGAYTKLSCHRPNKLLADREDGVKWVNGSGQDITTEALRGGWRSSKRSVGYDLLQLNHYALRSAESFLIKRQRGRALHVDRSIGLNYWIRMDWSYARDITIKRNIPRLKSEIALLMRDSDVRRWHRAGVYWHQAKATELRSTAEFEDLYQQALALKLTETERVAYALSLDMES
ncbi:MAG: glycosyltransferase family 2 protein [Rhodobacteraceae bacterium]|nr:glycosyltransferase family 2 protein [Paracoccaceae bacterium]